MRSSMFSAKDQKPFSQDDWKRAQLSMTAMPTDFSSGLNAIGRALYNKQRQNPFPPAPGGGNKFGNVLSGLFGLGAKKGGLY